MRHISDFMGFKEPRKITVNDIEAYYNYQLHRGNLTCAKKRKDGQVSKKEVSKSNPEGISVNTLSKHKTALKQLWKFMIKKQCYGVTTNVVIYSEIPKVEIVIDGKTIKTRKIQPKQTPLSLEQLNYTLNDAIQNEHDRSIALMIALGAIGGLRRGEAVALKIGRYYHDERMLLGEEMWQLNDFKQIRQYYEELNELILIDEAIRHDRVDKLGFPKNDIIRMVGKPKCLDEIVEYAMEQRIQITNALGCKIRSDERLYLPMINVIQQNVY
jgi:integrase